MRAFKQVKAEEIYRNIPLEKIPWNNETPPDELVLLIENGNIKPCDVIDLGCGAGNYAVYLAGKGFNTTGVDISPTAIEIAKGNAKKNKVNCDFLVTNVLGDLGKVIQKTFGFAYDWELLHHIFPQKRKKYLQNVQKILNPGAKYLSVCFNVKDPGFGGSGKYRKTQLGTVLYFSSEKELKKLFSSFFHVIEFRTLEIKGKSIPHIVNYAFMEKKF